MANTLISVEEVRTSQGACSRSLESMEVRTEGRRVVRGEDKGEGGRAGSAGSCLCYQQAHNKHLSEATRKILPAMSVP